MQIRIAKTEDIPGILCLLRQVGQVHRQIRPDIFAEGTLKYDSAALEILLQDPLRPIFVACRGNFVAGYCFCILKQIQGDSLLVPRKELYIDDLCVDKNHRRQGIAEALYRHAEDHARSLSCHSVTLNVWCGNEGAQDFYDKMGMRPRNIYMENRLGEELC